ncbi:MAG TPA: GAF domain-containing protein [Planctomycetota bacterium]|nr:GAF domain-containing protein [Planctomycetota bacterium]
MDELERALAEGDRESIFSRALDAVLRATRSEGGTIHVLQPDGKTLRLAASSAGMPEPLLAAIREIPIGRGMAGIAAERRAPVRSCDLQRDDADGSARPGARAAGLRGTICVPMIASDGRLAGTLGVGSREEREFSAEEVAGLADAARRIADAGACAH